MTAVMFATVADVQARTRAPLTDSQQAQAAAFLADVAAEILVYAPGMQAGNPVACSISCQAVLRALPAAIGVRSRTVGGVAVTYAGADGVGVSLTADEIATLQRAGTGGGAFSIRPWVPPHRHAPPCGADYVQPCEDGGDL
jgi:hypothetical protein